MEGNKTGEKAQSSFELLITLAFGLVILIPIVVIAFVQIANSNASLASVEAQQAANKLSSVATLIGSEGPPARQLVQVSVPEGVKSIYIGNTNNGVGHEIIFVIVAPINLSYITAYTPVNVSGNLSTLTSQGTYLINVTATGQCQSNLNLSCVYLSPVT
ncbi:MAG: hypothetical protein KGH72_01890 [Candidatus Micrarchaeota archaeon]|nr:hypothetical protein [Candidatus Micrarchaeota archaeon]